MSTIIRVPPEQIPTIWDTIKLAVVSAQEVDPQQIPSVLTNLLHGLLNETTQCVVVLDDQRVITQIAITQIVPDSIVGERQLWVRAAYSFRLIREEDYQLFWDGIVAIARQQKCADIFCQSRNPRLWKMFEQVGMKEDRRQFVYRVGG